MATDIVQRKKLPRAIAKEKDGIVMFWVEEFQVAGLHVSGIAKLLGCDPKTIARVIETLTLSAVLDAEILTEKGVRSVTLVTETHLPELLEAISLSKAKSETRKMAMQALKKLAAAGFKLAVMLELAPHQLKAQVDRHVEELEILKIKAEIAKQEAIRAKADESVISLRHYVVTALPEPVQQKILGYKEVKVTEYVDRTIAPDGSVSDGVGITYIQKRYGFKSTKEAWAWLEKIGMGKLQGKWQHQLKAVESSVLPREYLDELDTMYGDFPRQRWLGE